MRQHYHTAGLLRHSMIARWEGFKRLRKHLNTNDAASPTQGVIKSGCRHCSCGLDVESIMCQGFWINGRWRRNRICRIATMKNVDDATQRPDDDCFCRYQWRGVEQTYHSYRCFVFAILLMFTFYCSCVTVYIKITACSAIKAKENDWASCKLIQASNLFSLTASNAGLAATD